MKRRGFLKLIGVAAVAKAVPLPNVQDKVEVNEPDKAMRQTHIEGYLRVSRKMMEDIPVLHTYLPHTLSSSNK